MKSLPDFIIIGAAKCGTTTLYKMLTKHPKVFMSTPKEPEFFARDDIYQKGFAWYADLFAPATDGQLCGEASTLYSMTTLFPHTVARMHAAVPQAKLIYVLRAPVQRAYSYYTQLIKNYQNSTRRFSVNRDFDECLFPDQYPNRCSRDLFFAGYDKHLPDDPRTLIDGSRYITHINNYLSVFDRSQLLLVDFEDLVKKPDEVMLTVCNFLNLDIGDMPVNTAVRENISSEHFERADKEIVRQRFIATVKNHSIGRKLIQLLPTTLKKPFLDWYSTKFNISHDESRPPKMSLDTENYLHTLFDGEVSELAKLWQRDLSSWQQKA